MSAIYESLKNKTALVTGGSKGIGKATCTLLAANGVSVVVHYNKSAASALEVVKRIEENGGRAFAVQADLGDPASIGNLVEISNQELGHIDILVNNAGEMTHAAVTDLTDELWEDALKLHLTAVFQLTRAFTPSMIENRWGRIINVSSQVAYTGSNNHAHYAAAKAGLLGFTFSIAKELGEYGITANLISPGRITTDMIIPHIPTRKDEWLKQTPLKRFGEPDEVASTIVFLASGESAYITGANIHVNGGLVMG
ncbi:MAG: 3-oxoacyl-ACP reductase FabG [Bacteroidales bacterium]|nr:3-oxoacyl-ACP reductase FabG [Bacteroidales bacterium]